MKDSKKINLLGFSIYYENFNDLYSTFNEVFIKEDYYFGSTFEGTFIIDAGANIGITTIYFKWRFPEVKILCFEMQPDTFALLSRNIKENKLKNVEGLNFAVGEKEGKIQASGLNRATTIDESMRSQMPKKTSPEHVSTVSVKKLSNYIDSSAQKVILKMDIEGAEYQVIKELNTSGKLALIDCILFEFHAVLSEPHRYSELCDMLKEANFTVKVPDKDREDHFIVIAEKL